MKKDVDAFLKPYSPAVRRLALAARRLVLQEMPKAVEQVDPPSKIIAYGYDRTYARLVCAIAPYTAHVNLIFSQGTRLPDPRGLLQGTGKYARHVKFTTIADIEKPAVKALLAAAIAMKSQTA